VWWRAKCNPTTRWNNKREDIFIYLLFSFFFFFSKFTSHSTHNTGENFTITHGSRGGGTESWATRTSSPRPNKNTVPRLIGLAVIFISRAKEFGSSSSSSLFPACRTLLLIVPPVHV
jgi:hypothetical protein